MMLDVAGLEAFVDGHFSVDAFRLETRDRYGVASDGDDVSRYLAGELEPDPARKNPWLAELRAEAAAGRHRSRVHILRSPLSDYLRYECEWGYLPNSEAGEEIRILDLAEVPEPHGLVDHDFWLLDDEHCAVMIYEDAGAFVGAHIVSNVPRYKQARRAAWAAAVPFADYWRDHPQFWRKVPV